MRALSPDRATSHPNQSPAEIIFLVIGFVNSSHDLYPASTNKYFSVGPNIGVSTLMETIYTKQSYDATSLAANFVSYIHVSTCSVN